MILIICRKKWQSVPSSFKPRLWYGAFANIAKMNLIICKNKSSKYEPSYFGCGLFILSLTIFHPHQQWRSLSSPFCPACFTGGHIAAGEPAELAEQHLKIKSRHSAIVSKLLSVNFVVFVFMLIGEILRRELNNQCHILSIQIFFINQSLIIVDPCH